jgi:hypothetical protein
MNATTEPLATTGCCGGDDGAERALPAMRASSLASLDEDGLEFDERCCTMSSPAADESDISADCAPTGSPAQKLPEEGIQPYEVAAPSVPPPPLRSSARDGGRIYL